jgi:site-specific DNA-methyltransferase (adenine-specific)
MTAHEFQRLPKDLQHRLANVNEAPQREAGDLALDRIHLGDARALLPRITAASVAISIWSPPYFVGKDYESHLSFAEWQELLREVIRLHHRLIRPGGFLVINIADILCFKDSSMPRIQAEAVDKRRSEVTLADVMRAQAAHPSRSRYELAEILGCSEQTIDRRLNGNNIRGGKYQPQTRVKIVGGMIEDWAVSAGFYPYDRRIWVKDPAWQNSRWTSLSYRSVDEFEYVYIFWRPGITTVNRGRLTPREWREWGSRAVWTFPSVRNNRDHESKFPLELPRRVIRLLTDPGDTVLDCFLGSGTAAIAALLEHRRFIGIEVRKASVALARRRLAAARAALCLAPCMPRSSLRR